MDQTTTPSQQNADDCTICLSSFASGPPSIILSCNHKFHVKCLALNVQARNNSCPLCRATIEADIVQLFTAAAIPPVPVQTPPVTNPVPVIPPSVEEPIDEATIQVRLEHVAATRSLVVNENPELIKAVTTFEYGTQSSETESNIYGLITLEAPTIPQTELEVIATSRSPIDLICVVDRSGSMSGQKIALLKQTLNHIVEQLNEFDRMAIVSFNTTASDLSRGLKRMTAENQQVLKNTIQQDLQSSGGTYIGSGLQMAISLFQARQTRNPVGAVLLLTDGQDNETHDYTTLMATLPEGVQCHTFGYGDDHTASLLVRLAQLGNDGSFTYIDELRALGSAFAMGLGGIFSCVAKQVMVNIEFNGDYQITHFHSNYKYEPTQLPSNKLIITLSNLNAEEKRNLLFQLHVPKLVTTSNVEISSEESMSQGPIPENQSIGHVSLSYVNPRNDAVLHTDPVPFILLRSSDPPSDLLQVNHTLDCQRNRIETMIALEQAMAENDYSASRLILKAQVDKIRASASVNDPFCQELINDLSQVYPSESQYRSYHSQGYRCHQSERGTYASNNNSSSLQYQTNYQRRLAETLKKKYSS